MFAGRDHTDDINHRGFANPRVRSPQMTCQINDKIHQSDDTVRYLMDRRQHVVNVVKITSIVCLTW